LKAGAIGLISCRGERSKTKN